MSSVSGRPMLKISDHKKKLWLDDNTNEGQRRYLLLRKEMRKYVIRVKVYDKKDFGATQWAQFTKHLTNLKILDPVRAYLTEDPSEYNLEYRTALDKIMIDVLKKMRGSFKRIYGRAPECGEEIDPSALRIDDDGDDGEEDEIESDKPATVVKTPAKRRFNSKSIRIESMSP